MKRDKKAAKLLSLLLVLVLTLGMLPGAALAAGAEQEAEYQYATLEYYSKINNEFVSDSCYYTDDWFLAEATERNDSLALISAQLSAAGADDEHSSALLRDLGFEDAAAKRYDSSAADDCAYTLGTKTIKRDGRDVTLAAVVFQGDLYGGKGWQQNVTVNVEGYEGPDQAAYAAAAKAFLSDFDALALSGDVIVWLCGQSRGGAVANLAAAYLLDRENAPTVFCRTFESPATTMNADACAVRYDSIQNYLSDDDPVTMLPPWGMVRYGQEIAFNLEVSLDEVKEELPRLNPAASDFAQSYSAWNFNGDVRGTLENVIQGLTDTVPAREAYSAEHTVDLPGTESFRYTYQEGLQALCHLIFDGNSALTENPEALLDLLPELLYTEAEKAYAAHQPQEDGAALLADAALRRLQLANALYQAAGEPANAQPPAMYALLELLAPLLTDTDQIEDAGYTLPDYADFAASDYMDTNGLFTVIQSSGTAVFSHHPDVILSRLKLLAPAPAMEDMALEIPEPAAFDPRRAAPEAVVSAAPGADWLHFGEARWMTEDSVLQTGKAYYLQIPVSAIGHTLPEDFRFTLNGREPIEMTAECISGEVRVIGLWEFQIGTPETVSVIFDAGQHGIAPEPVSVNKGVLLNHADWSPEDLGTVQDETGLWRFHGWYDASGAGWETLMANDDLTLYAGWTMLIKEINLTYAIPHAGDSGDALLSLSAPQDAPFTLDEICVHDESYHYYETEALEEGDYFLSFKVFLLSDETAFLTEMVYSDWGFAWEEYTGSLTVNGEILEDISYSPPYENEGDVESACLAATFPFHVSSAPIIPFVPPVIPLPAVPVAPPPASQTPAEEDVPEAEETKEPALDYNEPSNWAYFALGEDTDVDVFLICPTVDTRSERNSFDLNEKLKARFVNALDMEKGIYADAGRLYSPYYRQMSMNAYKLSPEEKAEAQEVAYADISAAFRWYLDRENGGRGIILAGFSQGAQMCLELMKEYYGGDGAEASALREGLVAVYAIGWSVTEEMTAAYPQIVPVRGETDTGTVICFDCEDGTLADTLVIPAGAKALSINPLNWKTDGTAADKALNLGAVMSAGAEPIPALCGAYLGSRGELVVTDVSPEDYPAGIDIFPEGSYHIYDYLFFFTNLKDNVAARTNAWRTGLPFKDVPADAWYTDGVKHAYVQGLMEGTGPAVFSPALNLTRAQLVTILWRLAGRPIANSIIPYSDVNGETWYTEAVRWAAAEKITDRAGSLFGPEDKPSREEAVLLLWNTAKYIGTDVSIGENTNILSYSDAFDLTDGYAPAMQWAVGAGIIQGTGGGKLSPQGKLTRAQTAVLLQRFSAAQETPSPLSLWTAGSEAAEALIAYIEATTDESNPDYIPPEDRIAVFDLDGTLFCETDPNYFDYTLLKYRVLEDPDYRDRASEFEREVAGKIKEQNETGKSFPGLEVDHGRAVASAFAGMTLAEFNAYIQEFKKQPMPSYTGMNRGDGWYLPMLQVVDYLQENGFTVYIVSGTDRLIVRGIVDNSPLNIPNRQIIGSDETIVSSNQGDADGLNYVFAEGDELILGGDFLIKNLKMNKVAVIMQEIGQQPVLSFGNSTGDSSMAEFVTSGNPYRSLAFMLCCDDTERENGSPSKAEKMFALCEEFDWIPVSMKNDWTTIYGDGITYLGKEALRPAA